MNKEFKRMMELAGLNEIKVNILSMLEVKAENIEGTIYYSFKTPEEEFSLHNWHNKEYVEVYLNEDDIYEGLHRYVIDYLNKNKIPFVVYDEEQESYINDKTFEIPEDNEDMFNNFILINKKNCLVPLEYREEFKKY